MEDKPMKVPIEAVLKWYKKKTDNEIAELHQKIEQLEAYITELEDEEKHRIKIESKAIRKADEDYKSLVKFNKELENRIRILKREKEELLMRVSKNA